MSALSLLERVDLQLLIGALLIVLSWGAVLALAICWRIRSDRKAAATARSGRLKRLPRNLSSGWDRLDEHGRTW